MSMPLAIVLDDVGLDRHIDEAAVELARNRRISALSCMVGAPHWSAAVPLLRALDPAATDIGLHLDLTLAPLRLAPRRLQQWAAGALTRRIDRPALLAEIEAQLDRFEADLGRPPAHVDGHQHVHQFPVIRELLCEALTRRSPARPWLRVSDPAIIRGGGVGIGAKSLVIRLLGSAGLRRLAQRSGLPTSERLLGVYDFRGGAAGYAGWLDRWLSIARTGDVLMVHAANAIVADDPLGRARPDEFEVLGGWQLPLMLSRHDVAIGPLSKVLAVPGQTSMRR